jgi:hypothetical protein
MKNTLILFSIVCFNLNLYAQYGINKESFPDKTEFYREKLSTKYTNEIKGLTGSSYVSSFKIIVNTNDSISRNYELFLIDSNIYSLEINLKCDSDYYKFSSFVNDSLILELKMFKKVEIGFFEKSEIIEKCNIFDCKDCFKIDDKFCENAIVYDSLLYLEKKVIKDIIAFNHNNLLNTKIMYVRSMILDKNISLLNYYKYSKDTVSNDILKYTEGYSQAYEIYLENKSTAGLDSLLNQYMDELRWPVPSKAFVIAKVLYLRVGDENYLKTLRKAYEMHKVWMELPPEVYELNIIEEPFKDYFFEKRK